MIDLTRPLRDTHMELCAEFRRLTNVKANGTAECSHCKEPESSHLRDARCTVSTLSPHFHWKLQAEFDRVNKALSLIEELLKL